MELNSHWGVNMEKLTGPDWKDTGFFGIYSTLEKVDEIPEEVPSQFKSGLRSIPEEPVKSDYQEPRTEHERGYWDPEITSPDPQGWTPTLDPIPEEEDDESWHSVISGTVLDEGESYLALREQEGGSSSSSSAPDSGEELGKVLWMSRGSTVLLAPTADRKSRRNNQVLSKAKKTRTGLRSRQLS
jgi:hypothetical protein